MGVAHCNFQLRGAESEEDEVLVEEEAKKYGVEFTTSGSKPRPKMERTGESMEMAARRLRYAWFDTLSRGQGLHGRGDRPPCRRLDRDVLHQPAAAGLRGLTGISTQVGRIIRPLMFRFAQGDPRICRSQPHPPVPRGFVEPLDQIPAQ